MGLPNVMQIGRSGMNAAKAGIATSGHNIANANTEGFSRQRVEISAQGPVGSKGKGAMGQGVNISRVSRLNDEYIDKQVRAAGRDLAAGEERDLVLKQTEDVFNEMGGEGLNRLMSHFFNEFRKLSNEPENEAIRQSVRESTQAVVNDFKRLRGEVESVREHIDSRIEGHAKEVNLLAGEVKDLNIKIKTMEINGTPANDLMDRRDQILKDLSTKMDLNTHKDAEGNYVIDIKGVGPLVVGSEVQNFNVQRTAGDENGKKEGSLDVMSSASANGVVTHQIKGGKIGALLDTRDKTLTGVLDRLDDLAYSLADSVNQIHEMGFTRDGRQGVSFFTKLNQKERAAEFIDLSDSIKSSVNAIATAALPDSPGDNRIAVAVSGLQNLQLMNGGKASMDDFYNSIVSDIGVTTAHNKENLTQQKDILTQLNKMRDQVSGVSIDEETTNLMQFQHSFDASAKVIQVADDLLKTVLNMR